MKYVPSIAFDEMSGSAKGVTAAKTRGRKYIRNRGYGGSVRTSAQASVKSVFKKHGLDTSSNNIADACAIAHLGRAYYEWTAGRRDFLAYETEVLKKISKERKPIQPYGIDLTDKKVVMKKK